MIPPSTVASPMSKPLRNLRVRLPSVPLPEKLLKSIKTVYNDMPNLKKRDLKEDISRTQSSTMFTKPPIPNLKKGLKQYKTSIELGRAMDERKEDNSQLRQVDYITFKSLPALYHISHQIFHELSALDSGFSPWSMLDVGHNASGSVWAAHQIYGKSLGDIVIHEHSKREYDRTKALLNIPYSPHIPDVQIRGATSFPRASNKFDLVSAVNYFPSLQEYEVRKWLDKVWERTEGYLMIADIGNMYTSKRISDIREYFLRRHGSAGHILAPCPHASACPMRKKGDPDMCRFVTANMHLDASWRTRKAERELLAGAPRIDYSYLLVGRGEQVGTLHRGFDRVVAPVSHSSGTHRSVSVTVCGHDGMLWKNRVWRGANEKLYMGVVKLQTADLVDGAWREGDMEREAVSWTVKTYEESVKKRREKNERNKEKKLMGDLMPEIMMGEEENERERGEEYEGEIGGEGEGEVAEEVDAWSMRDEIDEL